MDACVNAYGMRMPARFADMTLDEMEYDGGKWSWSRFRTAAIIGGCLGASVAVAVFTCGAGAGVSVGLASTALEAAALGGFSGAATGSGGYIVTEILDGAGIHLREDDMAGFEAGMIVGGISAIVALVAILLFLRNIGIALMRIDGVYGKNRSTATRI